MLDPSVLPGFVTAAVLVIAAPGPDNAYISAVAADRGTRAGVLSACGMALGMVVHVVAAALGLAVLLHSAPTALTAVRLAGAAYLAWLAFTTLRSAGSGSEEGAAAPDRQVVGRAVLTNLTNPKVILFFAAFLPQFVRDGHGPAAVQMLVLGSIFLVLGLVIDVLVGVVVGRLAGAAGSRGRATTVLRVVAGLTFATLSALLVLEVLRS